MGGDEGGRVVVVGGMGEGKGRDEESTSGAETTGLIVGSTHAVSVGAVVDGSQMDMGPREGKVVGAGGEVDCVING